MLGEIPSVVDVALQYAALGFRVIPVMPDKKPPLLNWTEQACTNPETIQQWWRAFPTANVGICPDEDFCVLDIDVKNGGFETLAKLEDEHGKLMDTVSSQTGGGGKHIFYRVDPARDLHRMPAGKGTGIEILKKGHQGIEYPSLHASGNRYEWIKDIRIVEKAFWPMAPEWFYKPVEVRLPVSAALQISGLGIAPRPYFNGSTDRFEAYCLTALANQRQELANAPQGDRNNALNIAALKLGHLAHYGFFSEAKAKDELRFACDLNGLIADAGLPAFEATFQSGWRKGITEPYQIKDREEYSASPRAQDQITDYTVKYDPETGEIIEPRHRFNLVPFLSAVPNLHARYHVKGLIPSEGMVIVWGPPKCGKSFWAADVCCHIAAGIDYRGKRVRKGKVVYVAAEGASGFMGRLQAWRDGHPEIDPAQMVFYTVPQRLNLTEEYALLISDIIAQIGDDIPDVVALDTLNRTFSGSESSDEDMTAYITAADAIKTAFHCAVIIIHHCGIDGTRPRGHTSLTGAADAQIAINRSDDGVVTSKLEWMKDGEEGFETHSKLEIVELGIDEDGDQVTTCFVVESDTTGQNITKHRTISSVTNQIFTALKIAVQEAGITHGQHHIPPSAMIVPVELWRKYAYARSPESNQDTRKRAFARAVSWLQDNGFIGIWNDHVWCE